jgi:hypothetical protein
MMNNYGFVGCLISIPIHAIFKFCARMVIMIGSV